jgi:hypothetical protein
MAGFEPAADRCQISPIQTSPDSAFVLAYGAACQACTALLAEQGLRPTTSGGHYAVEESVRAMTPPSSPIPGDSPAR